MMNKKDTDAIGLIPAAGFARRISPLPCSKEIYPIRFDDKAKRLKVVSSCLFESINRANVNEAIMVIREGKWDLPAYFNRNNDIPLNLAYRIVLPTKGVPETLDHAYPFIKEKKILLGFPDIMFYPSNAMSRLVDKLNQTQADVVLGLFRANNKLEADMVETDKNGIVKKITPKPDETALAYTWILAVWEPGFTEFMHSYLLRNEKKAKQAEIQLGNIIEEAISYGLTVSSVKFDDGDYLDIGTPKGLKRIDQFVKDYSL